MKKMLIVCFVLSLISSAEAAKPDYTGLVRNPDYDRIVTRPGGAKVHLYYYEACKGQVYLYTDKPIEENLDHWLSTHEPKRGAPFSTNDFFMSQQYRDNVCSEIPSLNPKLDSCDDGVYIKAKVPPQPQK